MTAPTELTAQPAPQVADQLTGQLADLMALVLGLETMPPDESFFAAGGTSMHAELLARTASTNTGHTITFTDVFLHPSARSLAAALTGRGNGINPADPPEPADPPARPAVHPVSENQAARLQRVIESDRSGRRLFRSDSELIVTAWDVAGALDINAFRGAVDQVVERHSALRTAFGWDNDVFTQQVRPATFGLEEIDATHLHPSELIEAIWQPLSLREGQLARFVLARTAPDRWRLMTAFEHLVTDGVSVTQILEDLAKAYNALVTGDPIPRSDSDDIEGSEFSRTEENWCTSDAGRAAERHWLEVIGDGPVWRPIEGLPIAPPDLASSPADVLLTKAIPRSVAEFLPRTAAMSGTTIHGLTVYALARAMADITACRDVTIYWYTANRNLPDVATTVGSLAGLTMARIPDVPEGAPGARLSEVASIVSDSMAYAFYPIDRIARIHRPDQWVMPDDQPLLVIHVNRWPSDWRAGDAAPNPDRPVHTRVWPHLTGLNLTRADLGRRDRRGYTIDPSLRYTGTDLIVGISVRADMLTPQQTKPLLDRFAAELTELAGLTGELKGGRP